MTRIYGETELATHDFAYADIDLRTSGGREGYAEFVTGGGVPSSGPGVSGAQNYLLTIDEVAGLSVELGSFVAEIHGHSSSQEYSSLTYQDGTELVTSTISYGQSALELTQPRTRSGAVDWTDSSTIIVIDNLGDLFAKGEMRAIAASYGVATSAGISPIQIEFTGDDLVRLAELAK